MSVGTCRLPAGERTAALSELLDDYRPGAFFFASPDGSLLAEGVHTRLRVDGVTPAELALRARDAMARAAADGVSEPIIVGALPFAPAAAAELIVPRRVRRGAPVAAATVAAPPSGWTVRHVPEPAGYEDAVAEALRRIDRGEMEKVVLARSLELTAGHPVDVAVLLRALARRDPHAYAFAAELPAGPGGGRRTLLGASPELLVGRTGSTVISNPLAGSAARSADCAEDRRRAAALGESGKDRHEHGYVVRAVTAVLRDACADLCVPSAPMLMSTLTMWHLSTRIAGRVREPAISSLQLAAALHPTPAVCGMPTGPAARAIAELEAFDRGFYAGAVGWCDARGDGQWAVAIRCAEVSGAVLRLFAGAGIVAGSRPDDELAETTAKLRTMLGAIGLDEHERPPIPGRGAR